MNCWILKGKCFSYRITLDNQSLLLEVFPWHKDSFAENNEYNFYRKCISILENRERYNKHKRKPFSIKALIVAILLQLWLQLL